MATDGSDPPLCGFKQQRAFVQLELADAFAAVGCLYVESTSDVNELGGSAVGRPREDPQRNGDAEAVIPQRRKRADAVDAGIRKRLACERKGHSVPPDRQVACRSIRRSRM